MIAEIQYITTSTRLMMKIIELYDTDIVSDDSRSYFVFFANAYALMHVSFKTNPHEENWHHMSSVCWQNVNTAGDHIHRSSIDENKNENMWLLMRRKCMSSHDSS